MVRPSWSRLVSRVFAGVLLTSATLGTFGVGCAEEPVVPKKVCDKQFVTLQIYGSGTVNPNENGNPRPVRVRLYQLANDLKLQNARYDDVLLLRTRVSKLSQAKLEHEYRLYRDDELLTTAHSVLACVDREGNIKRIPEVLESLKRPAE